MEPRIDGPRFMKQHKDVGWINGRLAAVIKMVAAPLSDVNLLGFYLFVLLFEATTAKLCGK